MRGYIIRPRQCQTLHFSFEATISGINNVRSHTVLRARLQYQIPTMSDHTLFVRDYNIRPRQCQTLHFSFETTILSTNNVRPHTFRARLQYQTPTMSDHTLFVRDHNIRPRQCQTLHFSFETTISGTNNVRPHTFRARLQCQTPTMSDHTLFVYLTLEDATRETEHRSAMHSAPSVEVCVTLS